MGNSKFTFNELVFIAVRKIWKQFTAEERKKFAGVCIVVEKNAIQFDWENKETLGNWVEGYKTITYYENSIKAYIANQKEEDKVWKFESVIEHELLHAIGLDHEGIKKYRDKKKGDND